MVLVSFSIKGSRPWVYMFSFKNMLHRLVDHSKLFKFVWLCGSASDCRPIWGVPLFHPIVAGIDSSNPHGKWMYDTDKLCKVMNFMLWSEEIQHFFLFLCIIKKKKKTCIHSQNLLNPFWGLRVVGAYPNYEKMETPHRKEPARIQTRIFSLWR